MDTHFLESFLIVAESGSVAEAARRLDLTPAAVAQRIRSLEAEMGVRLLTRAGHTTRPTEAGRAILDKARQLVNDTRDLRAIATADTLAGQLRIGAISTSVTGILPKVLMRLSRECPQLDIYVMPGTSMELYQKVSNGEVDVALLVQPPFELLKSCDWMPLREESLLLIASASMPIHDTQSLLLSQPFIRYDRNYWGGRLADQYLQHLNIKPRERLELDALDAIAVLVDRGLGISLVPDWAPPWPEGLSLNRAKIEAPAYVRRIGMLWMRNSPSIGLIQTFRLQTRAALEI